MAAIRFDATGDASGLLNAFQSIRDDVRKTARQVEQSGMSIESVFEKIGKVAGVAFSFEQAKGFIDKVKEVRSYFQDIETSMEVFLGSREKAAKFTKELKDYAYYNMFEFSDLADASKQMIAFKTDVEEVIPVLDQLSNVATGTKAPLDELVRMYNNAKSTGQLGAQQLQMWATKGVLVRETLEEMGVQTQKTGASFEQLQMVLNHITGEGGMFHDLMKNQMSNLSAEEGQLADELDAMYNEIGENWQDLLRDSIKLQIWMVENYDKIGKAIISLVGTFGVYRAALVTTTALEKVAIMSRAANIYHTNLLAVATDALTKKMGLLNVVMNANPYVMITTLLVGAAGAMWMLYDSTTAETIARRKANDEITEFSNKLDEQKNKIERYIQTLQDANATEYEKAVAWEMLNKLAPTLTDKYDKATLATMDMSKVTKELAENNEQLEYEDLQKRLEQYSKKLEQAKAAEKAYMESSSPDPNGVRAQAIGKVLEDAKAGYDLVAGKLAEIDRIRKQIAEDNKPIEIKIQEANENASAKREIYDFYKRAADLAGELKEAHDIAQGTISNTSIPQDYERIAESARKKYDELIADLQKDVDDLRSKIANSPADIRLQIQLQEKQKALDDIMSMKTDWEATGATTIPLYFQIHYTEAENAMNDATQGARKGMRFDGPTGKWVRDEQAAPTKTAAQWKTEAYNSFETAKKALNDYYNQQDKVDEATFKKKLEELKSSVEEARKRYQDYGGSTSSKSSKTNDAAKRRAAKLQEERSWQEQLQKAIDDARTARSEATVVAIRNEGERERAEIEHNHKQAIDDINRQAEEMRKAVYEHNKRVWENEHKDGVYEDTAEGKAGWKDIKLANEQQELVYALLDKEEKEYQRLLWERGKMEIDAMRDYLKEYGSIEQQKLAITASYNEKIAKETDEWKKKSLEEEKRSVLDNITSESLLNQIDLGSVFEDYGIILASPLQSTVEMLQKYTQTDAFKKRSFEDQKTIYDAISNAKTQLGGIGSASFQAVGQSLSAYNEALLNFNAVSADLEAKTQESIDAEDAVMKANIELAKVKGTEKEEAAKATLESAQQRAATAKSNLDTAQTSYNSSQSALAEAQSKATESLQDFHKSIEKVGNVAKAVASGSMKQLWDALGSKAQTRIAEFMQGTHGFNKAAEKLLTTLSEKGTSLDSFKDKLTSAITQIVNAGNELDESGLGDKIKGIFDNILGDNSKESLKLGGKISKIITESMNKSSDDGESKEDAINSAINKAISAITSKSGSLWGLIIGLIFDLLDILAEGIGGLVQTILEKVGNAISGILSEIGSGKFFERIATGIGNLLAGIVKGIGNLISGGKFFGGSNEKDMEKRINELAIANEALATSIDSLSEVIKKNDNTNDESFEAYVKALQAEKDWEKNQREAINARASEWTNSGYGFLGLCGKGSFNSNMAGNDWEGWKSFTDALKEHGINKEVNRNNIWTLTPEEMKILRDFRPSEWAKLFNGDGHKNPQDLVNQYIERAGQQEELTSALNEKLTGYSWDGFLDAYKSMLSKLDSTTEDFADHIQELINNALIDSFVNGDAVKSKIKDLYKKIAEYASPESEGGTTLTESEINDIKAANEDISETMLAWREAAKQAGLITSSDSQYKQEASTKGFASVSQDTGEEMNGRFTALQITGENISQQAVSAVLFLTNISLSTATIASDVAEIKGMMFLSNSNIEDILKYTKMTYNQLTEKLDSLINNTKNL